MMGRFGCVRIWSLSFIIGLSHHASAVDIPVSNHSFENPVVAPGNFSTAAPPPGWTAYGSVDFGWRTVGVVNPNSTQLYLDPVPLGSNVAVVFLGPAQGGIPSGLQQALATTLQSRVAYTLTVAVGNMNVDPTPPHNAFNFTGFPGYRVELMAGGFVIAADHNTLLPGEGRFLTSTVYVATSSSHTNLGMPLGIRLINLDQSSGIEVNFDDVRLTAEAIPDPFVYISNDTNGDVEVIFTEVLQESFDLVAWTNVVPVPSSPLIVPVAATGQFYRASE